MYAVRDARNSFWWQSRKISWERDTWAQIEGLLVIGQVGMRYVKAILAVGRARTKALWVGTYGGLREQHTWIIIWFA